MSTFAEGFFKAAYGYDLPTPTNMATTPTMGEQYPLGNAKGSLQGADIPHKAMAGVSPGRELPADGPIIDMIKRDPEALKHYNIAVEIISNKFKAMDMEIKKNVPTQEDMARMFNDESMTDMGTVPESEQMEGAPGEEPMEGEEPEYILDENGEPMRDEQGNPITLDQLPPEEQEAL